MSVLREWWIISVHGYGEYSFYGTEDEAEEARAHKARWERGVGKKRLADRKNVEDRQKIAAYLKQRRWEQRNGVGLEANELEAIRMEGSPNV